MNQKKWWAALGLAALLGLWMAPATVAFDEECDKDDEGSLLADHHEEGEGDDDHALLADEVVGDGEEVDEDHDEGEGESGGDGDDGHEELFVDDHEDDEEEGRHIA